MNKKQIQESAKYMSQLGKKKQNLRKKLYSLPVTKKGKIFKKDIEKAEELKKAIDLLKRLISRENTKYWTFRKNLKKGEETYFKTWTKTYELAWRYL